MDTSKSVGTQVTEAIDMKYVDRGDPAGHDFQTPSFTFDGAFHELDLSGIVPEAGANHLVHIVIGVDGPAVSLMGYTKNGNTNNVNALSMRIQGAEVTQGMSGFVMMDANRKIQYIAYPTITAATLSVRGWWTD